VLSVNPLPKNLDLEAGMTDSWGRLKVSGDLHPKRHHVCTLHQKDTDIKKLTVKYSDTSAKLQDLSIALDDSTLLAELIFLILMCLL
jgi:hypothetical protein